MSKLTQAKFVVCNILKDGNFLEVYFVALISDGIEIISCITTTIDGIYRNNKLNKHNYLEVDFVALISHYILYRKLKEKINNAHVSK